jgi:hypothetical protein
MLSVCLSVQEIKQHDRAIHSRCFKLFLALLELLLLVLDLQVPLLHLIFGVGIHPRPTTSAHWPHKLTHPPTQFQINKSHGSDLQNFLSRPDVHCTKATAALFLKYIYRLDEGPLAPRTCNTTLSFDLLKGIHRTPLYVCKVGMFFTLFHLMSIPYQCTPLLIII